MTIHIDDPWQLAGSIALALIMLAVAYGIAFMGAFATGWVTRWVSFTIAGCTTVGAVMLVMAGGGWL